MVVMINNNNFKLKDLLHTRIRFIMVKSNIVFFNKFKYNVRDVSNFGQKTVCIVYSHFISPAPVACTL